jgi:hypothetical protein
MFTLIKNSTFPQIITKRLPGLVISLIIAEIFYKFHSFTLECVAFLGTWFLVDLTIEVIASKLADQNRKRSV